MCKFFSFQLISADITPEILKFCRVTKVNMFILVLVYVFNFDLFEFSAAILEKGLLEEVYIQELFSFGDQFACSPDMHAWSCMDIWEKFISDPPLLMSPSRLTR